MQSPQAGGPWSDLIGQSRPPRRRVWLVVAGALVAVALCVAVVAVLFGPTALLGVLGRSSNLSPTIAKTLVCPGAKASDVVPHDATGQFTVQPLYREALTYAYDATGQPTSQRVHLWSVDVLGTYPPMDDIFTDAVGGVDQWNTSLSGIDPSAFRCVVQDMQSANLTTQALSVLQKAAQQIPGPATTAYLVPWNTNTFYGASGEQSLLIPFWEADPLNRALPRDAASDWSYMPTALDHEYLEVVRYDRLGSAGEAYQTLLGNMVTDGLADNFAYHMNGTVTDWGISPQEEANLWTRFQPDLNQIADPNEASDMLGDPNQGIPNAAGYAIGDHIVALYLQKHPNATFNQLVGMDAQTIFDGSGYTG